MTQQTNDPWPECEQPQAPRCTGIKLTHSKLCLAHATDQDRAIALKKLGETGIIDVRGVQISEQLLDQILAAAPRGANRRPLFKQSRFERSIFDGNVEFKGATLADAAFTGATFSGDAWFDEARFSGDARFAGATFSGDAGFEEARFSGKAMFGEASFSGDAWFRWALFSGDSWFDSATFSGDARFDRALFSGAAWFDSATFSGDAWFENARFYGYAVFDSATFSSDAVFGEALFSRQAGFAFATFSGNTRFAGAIFHGFTDFQIARFEQARQFGPVLAYRGLVLDDAEFARPVQIEVSTTGLCCRRTRFHGAAQLRLRWARVVLDDADFPAPSILTGIRRLSSDRLATQEEQIAKAWERLLAGAISERPQLLSLIQTNVAGLALSNVMLADCRFAGAHNLDQMRLQGDVSFGLAPSPLGGLNWETRQVIAEERDWRAGRRRPWDWGAPRWLDWLGDRPATLDPAQVAGLYRALRKGREDSKDEPGAADFYYGEMEMRRRARHATGSTTDSGSRGRAERSVLTAYWLVSGYGLRSWRALGCLAVITGLFAIAFHLVGFAKPPQPVSYWTSLLYSFRATLSLTDSNVQLTAWGELLQGLLRLTGPVLLGLALLALRGRVKR
jgi:uncharacterized protein YjbI with pentapeptide repeats